MYSIVRRESFSDTTFLWEVLALDVARAAKAGHFVMLRLHEGSERIPLTVGRHGPRARDHHHGVARMEEQHMALSARYHVDPPVPGDLQLDRAAVYAGIPNRPDAPDNLFRLAIAFEERAAKLFQEQRARCAPASPEEQLYEELAAEEREHVQLLATEMQRWRQGKPGLL